MVESINNFFTNDLLSTKTNTNTASATTTAKPTNENPSSFSSFLEDDAPTSVNIRNISAAQRQELGTQLYKNGDFSLLELGIFTQDIAIKNSVGISHDINEKQDFLKGQEDYLTFLEQHADASPHEINTQRQFIEKLKAL